MNPNNLNGLTLQRLSSLITQSPDGFSAENGAIQYLGRQIHLHDGITLLTEHTGNTPESKQLLERLISLQPDIATQIARSKAQAIKIAASNLWDNCQYWAIEMSPTKEVQCAVFLESMRIGPTTMAEKLAETNSLTWAEKLEIMLAGDAKYGQTLSAKYWRSAWIPLSIRFEKAKNLFQHFSDTPLLAEEVSEINENMTVLNPHKLFKDKLLKIRQIMVSENSKLSEELLSEVDNIEKKFSPRVEKSGNLPKSDNKNFQIHTTRLLYLYAACCGFSQAADIAELASYIRSILYSADSGSIWHIAKELVYLSKQPNSIDYCRYIDAVAGILTAPPPFASQFEEHKQLSDINGFALLESQPLATYLTVLRANIDYMTPAYSQVLIGAVNQLESKVAAKSLPESKHDIKAKVQRLLLVIAACTSSGKIMDTRILGDFVSTIMEHGNIKNIPYLIIGLTRLLQSTPKIQQVLGAPAIKGGKPLRLAPLQLLAFVPDIISEDDVEELNQSLQNSPVVKRRMKDGKVFHQWLTTLEQALTCKIMNKTTLMQLLKTLTQSLTYEKLGLLHIIFKMGDSLHEFLNRLGLSCQKEGLPLLVAEIGGDAFVGKNNGISQWLFEQRHYHLLPSYMALMTEHGTTEITDLIHGFIQSSANRTFIENRQSPLNNPHLKAVYRQYPQFKAGWGANFSDFSETTKSKLLLSPLETLALTEDPWDLFISGLEVNNCQSPEGFPSNNTALMSFVMDGRNAMIVRKSQKGNILSRSVIRMVLDQDDRPALYLEMGYPAKSALLFIDAAREIAAQMELPLYHHVSEPTGEAVKLLEGRAPLDYFDALDKLMVRQKVTFTNVQRDVSVMSAIPAQLTCVIDIKPK